jgi:hypothetical protein
MLETPNAKAPEPTMAYCPLHRLWHSVETTCDLCIYARYDEGEAPYRGVGSSGEFSGTGMDGAKSHSFQNESSVNKLTKCQNKPHRPS